MADYLSIFPGQYKGPLERTRRLGVVDKLAIELFQDIRKLFDDDKWMDLIEEAVCNTSSTDFSNLDEDEKLMDQYFGELDKMEKRVLKRTCQALLNEIAETPDRVSLEALRAMNPEVAPSS